MALPCLFEALRTGNVSSWQFFGGGIRCRQGTPVWKNYKKWIAIGFHSYHQSIPWESILHHLSVLTKSLETPSIVILGMDSPVTSRNGTLHPQTLRTPQNRFSLKEANDHISVSLSARGKLLVAFLSLDWLANPVQQVWRTLVSIGISTLQRKGKTREYHLGFVSSAASHFHGHFLQGSI